MRLLWYLLAGLLLGYTLSTLWEWLYFRRLRLKVADSRVSELEAQLAQARAEKESAIAQGDDTEGVPHYESPVTLDIEAGEDEEDAEEQDDIESDASRSLVPLLIPRPAPDAQPVQDVTTPGSPPEQSPDPEFETEQHVQAINAASVKTLTAITAAAALAVEAEKQREDAAEPTDDQTEDEPPAPDQRTDPEQHVQAINAASAKTLTAVTAAAALAVEAEKQRENTAAVIGVPEEEVPSEPSPMVEIAAPRRFEEHPDDLTRVKGIGPGYMLRLYRAGIFTWSDVASTDEGKLRAVTRARRNADMANWKTQAAELAEAHERQNSAYHGPMPDNLTEVNGVGPRHAQRLFSVGICTFEQLAAALPAELEGLFPEPSAIEDFDFDRWLQEAAELARAKRQRGAAAR